MGSIRNKNSWDNASNRLFESYSHFGIFGFYSRNSALRGKIVGMESKYSGLRIASKQTLTCIIPTILILIDPKRMRAKFHFKEYYENS